MKYCPTCKQWNIGKPMRCRYCGRTWDVRICSAGHINPADTNFCGECGRTSLSEPADRSPLIIKFLKIWKGLIVIVCILFLILLIQGLFSISSAGDFIGFILFIMIMLIAINFMLGIMNEASKLFHANIFGLIIKIIKSLFTYRRG